MKTMRTNSPIDDPTPYDPPEPAKLPKQPKTDFAKLGTSRKWPAVDRYIDDKIGFYSTNLPGGPAGKDKTYEEKGKMWEVATTIIQELEDFKNKIEAEVKGDKLRR